MVTKGFAFLLKVKPGKEQELEDFLKAAEPLAEAEPDTTTWTTIRTVSSMDSWMTRVGKLTPKERSRPASWQERTNS